MIKGQNKRVVVLKTEHHPKFEQALFFMRENTEAENEDDIISEAYRVIGEADKRFRKKAVFKSFIKKAIFFILGVLAGGAAVWIFTI